MRGLMLPGMCILAFTELASALVAFSDDFESGVSSERWTGVESYRGINMLSDDSRAHSGLLSAMQPPTVVGSLYYMRSRSEAFKNMGPLTGDQTAVAKVWFWDDGNTAQRDFGGSIILAESGLQDFFSLGVFTGYSVAPERFTHYAWRTRTDWWNPTPIMRTVGWHEFTIEVKPYTGAADDVLFYIDGVLCGQGHRRESAAGSGTGFNINEVRLGIGGGNTTTYWYDDVSVVLVPEPASAGLLALAAVFLARRRKGL